MVNYELYENDESNTEIITKNEIIDEPHNGTQPVKKKRGRKPKVKKEEEPKVPKKRGRKPKGGQVSKTKAPMEMEKNIVYQNVILHLKCKRSDVDVKYDEITEGDILKYKPDVCVVEPTHMNSSVINNDAEYSFIEDEHIEPSKTHTVSNMKNKGSKSIVMNDSMTNTTNSIESHQGTSCNVKVIHEKLKKLELNLHKNNIHQKADCFWCTCPFDNHAIYIPKNFHNDKYVVYGNFCSPECACSFLFNEHIDEQVKFERYQLLNFVYGKTFNYKKNIKLAPNPYYTLDKYMGNLTINEWRSQLNNDRLLIVVDKPLTKVFPELYEDNNEYEIAVNNKFAFQPKAIVNKNDVIKDVFSMS